MPTFDNIYVRLAGRVFMAVALTAFTFFARPALSFGAETFDEKVIKSLSKNEKAGIVRCADIDGDGKTEAALSIDKTDEGDKISAAGAPVSRLAIFSDGKLQPVEDYSNYIESLELKDVDGDGCCELIYTRRGGMARILETIILKAKRSKQGDKFTITPIFKSDGITGGKFDILQDGGSGLPKIVVGGYVMAPGASEPHIEFSHTYGYDKTRPNSGIKLLSKYYARPSGISQEYEYAYVLYLENNKQGARKRLETLVESLKNTKSEANAGILKCASGLLEKCK